MKLEIVKMKQRGAPSDTAWNPALLYGPMVLHRGEFWQLVTPIAEEDSEPYGQTWLHEESPAFKSTGLKTGGVMQVADTFRFRVFGETLESVKRTGHWLNLTKDSELAARFAIAAQEAAEVLCDIDDIPIAF